MKKPYLFLLFLFPILGFSASEQSIWMAPQTILNQYHLSLSSNGSIQKEGTTTSLYGLTKVSHQTKNKNHTRYNLTYKGIPVWGRQIIIHTVNHKQPKITGVIISGIERDIPDNQPILSESVATSAIIAHVHTPIKGKEIQKIIYLDDQNVAHIAYLLSFFTQEPNKGTKNPHFIINATDGVILKEWDNIKTSVQGQGPGGNAIALPYREGAFQYGNALPNLPSLGTFPMDQWSFWCYTQTPDYRVINLKNMWVDDSKLFSVFPVFDYEETDYNYIADYGFCWPWSTLYTNQTDNDFAPVNESYSPINDAMYFVNETLELYRSHGVDNPLGTEDLPIRVYTHVNGFDNSFALPTYFSKGTKQIKAHQQIVLGNGLTYLTSGTQSTIAHELSHNFTQLNANLAYTEQSGGINESFSDMAAIAMMDQVRNKYSFYWDGKDWEYGRDHTKNGQPLRYIDHPSLDNYSIENAKDYTPKLDVHYSSGVFNRAFYLLANQPGWSISQAFHVMVNANQYYWEPNTTFDKAACGVIQAAQDNQLDPNAVIDSFDQVGVHCPS